MPHLVLLGDSIFDNAGYVPGHPAVIDQIRTQLPGQWQASLLAVDGNITSDVERQLARLPSDATHLVISTGGNDALGASGLLHQRADTVANALEVLYEVGREFRDDYHMMLKQVAKLSLPAMVCTIYDAIPGLGRAEQAALCLFNDVILREAFLAGLPVVDLRLVCQQSGDYSSISPIEPSHVGGSKIAAAVVRAVTMHNFGWNRSAIYS